MTKKKFEDSFVKISGLIGGNDYVRVAKSLL
ncbi:MAG: transcription factor, partial [Thaumarchaeota archaeon]